MTNAPGLYHRETLRPLFACRQRSPERRGKAALPPLPTVPQQAMLSLHASTTTPPSTLSSSHATTTQSQWTVTNVNNLPTSQMLTFVFPRRMTSAAAVCFGSKWNKLAALRASNRQRLA
ncbi:hypothetical protein MRX96_055980 [Rhipicephalus microplus]